MDAHASVTAFAAITTAIITHIHCSPPRSSNFICAANDTSTLHLSPLFRVYSKSSAAACACLFLRTKGSAKLSGSPTSASHRPSSRRWDRLQVSRCFAASSPFQLSSMRTTESRVSFNAYTPSLEMSYLCENVCQFGELLFAPRLCESPFVRLVSVSGVRDCRASFSGVQCDRRESDHSPTARRVRGSCTRLKACRRNLSYTTNSGRLMSPPPATPTVESNPRRF